MEGGDPEEGEEGFGTTTDPYGQLDEGEASKAEALPVETSEQPLSATKPAEQSQQTKALRDRASQIQYSGISLFHSVITAYAHLPKMFD